MYIPLKIRTDYSLLTSLIKINDLIKFCHEKNINCIGICDTNLFSSIEFYKLCKNNNIKPIIGLEVKINDNIVYLYAKNYDGYKNLLKINTIISERDLSIYELEQYKDNLIVVIPYKNNKIYSDFSFIDDLYISYSNNSEYKNALVISNNLVYINEIRAFSKDSIKYLKYLDLLKDEEEQDYSNDYFNLDISNEDIKTTEKFSKLINIEIPENNRYIPKYNNNSFEFLKKLSLEGLKKRLNNKVNNEYLNRLKYELSIINKMGFVDYFLIVYDYVLYAKKNNILVGPGRGSAAGSLVSYSIGITDIDPIKYGLLFERFLNPERISMPDIDIDFDSEKREDVINYVKKKYGNLNVSAGMTYATFKTRLVIRDISKILNIDERLINKFIKVLNKDLSLKNNLNNKDVLKFINNYKELKELYNICMHIEGLKKNISTHAAGIVIADRSLDEIIPIYKNEDVYMAGCGMENLEDLGLLKMDFLGLRNLTIINNIINKIGNLKLNEIPLNDSKTFELFSIGDTDGIFQFETPLLKKMITKFKPKNFNDLIAAIALVRPGPAEELDRYIKRKDNKEIITYYDESLKEILESTYGVIVYQEQVIQILVKMAGFSYAEADNIRRAISKKKIEIINKEKDNFIKRSIDNGYKSETSELIFNQIIKFADYGFNKSHSVAYAIISYSMAYLKCHYKSLFIFEIMNKSLGNKNYIKSCLRELKKNNININHVNINYSTNEFVIKDNDLYLPFKLINNFKTEVINNIIDERNNNGLYKDIFDLFKRTNKFITKNEYIKLIDANALSIFNINNKTLIENLDNLINYGNLYNDLGDDVLPIELELNEEYDSNILREKEIESYGFYITNHPTSKYNNKDIIKLENIKKYEFKNIKCYILVEDIKKIKTKNNEDMAFILGSDETSSCDFTIFPKDYYLLKNIEKNDIIKVVGKVSKRFDKTSVIVNNISKE